MSKRPPDATDCPGCPSGWVFNVILCPACIDRVMIAVPQAYEEWLKSRAAYYKAKTPETIANEAYWRGIMHGSARATLPHYLKANRSNKGTMAAGFGPDVDAPPELKGNRAKEGARRA